MTLPFLILAVLTLAGAVAAMTLRQVLHCVLALTIAFTGLAALYIQLGAQFVGLAQFLVYVGAVAILVVFAVLLTRGAEIAPLKAAASRTGFWMAGGAVTAAVFAVLAWVITASGSPRRPAQPQVTMQQIGNALMQRFVLPLEVMGLMLTAALIGAVVLAMRETSTEERQSTK